MGILQSGSIEHPQVQLSNNLKHQISQRVWKKLYLPLFANSILDVLISTGMIIKMVCVLVVWLHLRAGVSRSAANTILQAFQFIISTMIQLIEAALCSYGINIKLPEFKLPHDLCSAYGQTFPEPDIIRTACCPSCFALYSAPIPLKCQWKESPRSCACNTDLWKSQNTSRGPKLVPRQLYTTQSFDSWLSFFLSRQIIEDALDESFCPAWRDLTGLFSTARHLVFGIYIDWFNPFTNKIAGKHASCGAIVLYCLNLPPHLRYLPENTFIVGLTPPPNAPDMITISHIIEPLIDSVLKYATPPGQRLPTFRHPAGVWFQIKVAPLISDIEASHKAGGFMAHAQVWLNTATKSGRKAQAQSTGVRWTPLHHLPYWDPVKHVLLGYMHNWQEGVLKHQLHVLWAIGPQEGSQNTGQGIDEEEQWTETDVSESASELDELHREAAEAEAAPLHQNPSFSSQHSGRSSTLSRTPTQDEPHPYAFDMQDEDDEVTGDPDYIPDTKEHFTFMDAQLQAIRNCISNVTLPTWAQQPPTNLGEPSHGKLKAHEYLMLFSCIFPLIIPEFWHSETMTNLQHQHLQSFHHLVAATNILSSFKTSNASADEYTGHYIQYRMLCCKMDYKMVE
ncbi:uncharacterized protein LACBIDRAFT_308244 [Laccaria bicolor S238N-H82]|uniref:Predicted protein n=1 Tax=Laccaria bicolor (strain S238N-H82 / ATCC MYA-4686) TaxID=486041 RepID=B0DRX1_LACBS|nr:uncharacterized protein LACBIDRAFT_308244 [Laccaria bicolor S238N-H82]EDR02599.1 predicted protein [Laccaria bicolor S238N-H82]|eukprot:XP_001886643.1 predicted protein [Laccaria bicolor S238N-H82]